jgi:hypothetical protein
MDRAPRKAFTDAAGIYGTVDDFTDDVSSQIEDLKALGPTPALLSLSIQMRRDGFIHSLAVASSNEVMVLMPDIPGKHHGHPKVVENIHPSIISLFKDPDVKFTGFHFHRIAIIIKAQLGLDVQGFDIISSMTGERGPIPSPGQMAMRFLNPKDFPQFEVDGLWDDVVVDPPYTSGLENLIDRAWISARYVAPCFSSQTDQVRQYRIYHPTHSHKIHPYSNVSDENNGNFLVCLDLPVSWIYRPTYGR